MNDLTEEEKVEIDKVLKRALEISSEEITRIEVLKNELETIKQLGLSDSVNQIVFGPIMDTVICVRCKNTFYKFFKKYDHCVYCGKIVCKKCLVPQKIGSVKLLCTYCSKLSELQAISGAWHYEQAYQSPNLRDKTNKNVFDSENISESNVETQIGVQIVKLVQDLDPNIDTAQDLSSSQDGISVSRCLGTSVLSSHTPPNTLVDRIGLKNLGDYHIDLKDETVDEHYLNNSFVDVNNVIKNTGNVHKSNETQFSSKNKLKYDELSDNKTPPNTLDSRFSSTKDLNPLLEDMAKDEDLNPFLKDMTKDEDLNPFLKDMAKDEDLNPFLKDMAKDKDLNPLLEDMAKDEDLNPFLKDMAKDEDLNPFLKDMVKDENSKGVKADVKLNINQHENVKNISSNSISRESSQKKKLSSSSFRIIRNNKGGSSKKSENELQPSSHIESFNDFQRELTLEDELKIPHEMVFDKTSGSASPVAKINKMFSLRKKKASFKEVSRDPKHSLRRAKTVFGSSQIHKGAEKTASLKISKEYTRINGSIHVSNVSGSKFTMEVRFIDVTFIQKLPECKNIKCYIDCKVKSASTLLKQKTKIIKGESSPLFNQVLSFKGVNLQEDSYLLLAVKQKMKKLKNKKENIYGAVRIGNNIYCSNDEKAVWSKIWDVYQSCEDKWIDFSLPMLKPADSDLKGNRTSVSESTPSGDFVSTLRALSNNKNSQLTQICDLPNMDYVNEEIHMHKNVAMQGFLNLAMMYNKTEGTFYVKIVKLQLKNLNIMPSLMQNLYVKVKYDFDQESSLITNISSINRADMSAEWNQQFSMKIDHEKLSTYVIILDVFHERSKLCSQCCGQVALKVQDLLKRCPAISLEFVNCYFPLHQITSISPYPRIDSKIDLSISYVNEDGACGKLAVTVHSAGPINNLKTRRYLKDSSKIYLQAALLPCISKSSIHRSAIMTIENNNFEFTHTWNIGFNEILENKCIEIVVIKCSEDKKVFLAGCRIGTPTSPPIGEEWQDSNPQEHNLWKRLLQGNIWPERAELCMRNSMLSRFIEPYEYLNSVPNDLNEQEQSLISGTEFKNVCIHELVIELEMKYDDNNSLHFHLGTVSNLPSKSDPMCMIIHTVNDHREVVSVTPSIDLSPSWNQYFVLNNIHDVDNQSLWFVIGEKFVPATPRGRSSKKNIKRTSPHIDPSCVYGFVLFGENELYDSRSKRLSQKANCLFKKCMQRKGIWKSTFLTLSKKFVVEQMEKLLEVQSVVPQTVPGQNFDKTETNDDMFTPQDKLYRRQVVTNKDTKFISTIPQDKVKLEPLEFFTIAHQPRRSSSLYLTKETEILCDSSYIETRSNFHRPEINLINLSTREHKSVSCMNIIAQESHTESINEKEEENQQQKKTKISLRTRFSSLTRKSLKDRKQKSDSSQEKTTDRSNSLEKNDCSINRMKSNIVRMEQSSDSDDRIIPSCDLILSLEVGSLVLRISSIDGLSKGFDNCSLILKSYILDTKGKKHLKNQSSPFVASNSTAYVLYSKHISLTQFKLHGITIVLDFYKIKPKKEALGTITINVDDIDLTEGYSGTHKFIKMGKASSVFKAPSNRSFELTRKKKVHESPDPIMVFPTSIDISVQNSIKFPLKSHRLESEQNLHESLELKQSLIDKRTLEFTTAETKVSVDDEIINQLVSYQVENEVINEEKVDHVSSELKNFASNNIEDTINPQEQLKNDFVESEVIEKAQNDSFAADKEKIVDLFEPEIDKITNDKIDVKNSKSKNLAKLNIEEITNEKMNNLDNTLKSTTINSLPHQQADLSDHNIKKLENLSEPRMDTPSDKYVKPGELSFYTTESDIEVEPRPIDIDSSQQVVNKKTPVDTIQSTEMRRSWVDSPEKNLLRLSQSRNVEIFGKDNVVKSPSLDRFEAEGHVHTLKRLGKLGSEISIGSITSSSMTKKDKLFKHKHSLKKTLSRKAPSFMNISSAFQCTVNTEISYNTRESTISIKFLDIRGIESTMQKHPGIHLSFLVILQENKKEIISWESENCPIDSLRFDNFKYNIDLDKFALCTLKIKLLSVISGKSSVIVGNKYTLFTLCQEKLKLKQVYNDWIMLQKERPKEYTSLMEKTKRGFGNITLKMSLEPSIAAKRGSLKRTLSKKESGLNLMLNLELYEINCFELVPGDQLFFKIKLKNKSKTISKKKSQLVKNVSKNQIIAYFVDFTVKMNDMETHTLEISVISLDKKEKEIGKLVLGKSVECKNCIAAWKCVTDNVGKKSEFSLNIQSSQK